MLNRHSQSTYSAFRSPGKRTGSQQQKQTDIFAPIRRREGERYAVRIFTGLSTGACRWVRPRTGSEWWTTPRRTSMAVPPTAVGLCCGRHNRIKECLTSEACIDSVLVQKVLQFNFPTQQPLHIPAGQRKYFPTFSS